MKLSALLKDTFREILTTKSRFLSIFLIVALGSGFFAGLKSTCPDMLATAQDYYTKSNLMDMVVKSTMGIAPQDIEALEQMRSVRRVQGGYYADVFIDGEDNSRQIVHVISYNLKECDEEDYINKLSVKSGRLPDRENECVVDVNLLKSGIYALGDKITFYADTQADINDMLSFSTFTIVGSVESAQYVSYERGSASIGNGVIKYYIYVPETAFNYPVFTEVYITFNETLNVSFESEEYKKIIEEKTELIKEIAGTREEGRYNEITGEANDQIKAAQDKIDSAEKEYKAGLKSYNAEIKEAKQTIAESEEQLAQLKKLYEAVMKLKNDASANWEEDFDRLLKMMELFGGLGGLSKEDLLLAASTIDELTEFLGSTISKAENDLKAGKIKLSAAQKSGAAQLSSAKKQIDKGKKQIKEAKEELAKIEKPSWYIFSRDNNPGYSTYAEDAARIDKIAAVFPVFFILVAALVCTTTMTRMVEEQRTTIGTLKALGYPRGLILTKYLIYSGIASFLGSLFGLAVGFKVFPSIIFAAYCIMYTFPPVLTPFMPVLSVGCMAASIACTTLSSFFVCYREMFEVPAALMRPKVPKAGKRILLEKIGFIWNKIGFLKKVTIRNVLRYKRRMAMTVIGIAGCTALLFTGFGLQYAITEIVDLQYVSIFTYDLLGVYDSEISAEASDALFFEINDSVYTSSSLKIMQQSVSISKGAGNKREVYLVVPSDVDKLSDYINLRERIGHEPVYIKDNGVVVCEKISRLYDLEVGDEIRVSLSDTEYKSFTVSGICENYTLNYIYISPEAYEEAFAKPPSYNAFLSNMSDETKESELSTELLENKSILALSYSSEGGGKFRDIVGSLNYIVILIIVCAGALAFVVLYNLANINITERMREIATIKVLGFYDKEVSKYVNRENTIASVMGIGCGLLLGVPLEKFVIATAEVDAVMFVPSVNINCYVYAVILAALFTKIVNMVMHVKLKKINMVESLKSIE